MVYHIPYVDSVLEGFYVQHGKSIPVKYVKRSDTPKDEPFQCKAWLVPGTDKTRIEILREYTDYDRTIEYGYNDEYVLGGVMSGFDTSSVKAMSNMFSWCSDLTSLNLSGLDTAEVTDMSEMFLYCTSLEELDLSRDETKNISV